MRPEWSRGWKIKASFWQSIRVRALRQVRIRGQVTVCGFAHGITAKCGKCACAIPLVQHRAEGKEVAVSKFIRTARVLLFLPATLVWAFPILAAPGNPSKRNIVLVLMDNSGYSEVGVYGDGFCPGRGRLGSIALPRKAFRSRMTMSRRRCRRHEPSSSSQGSDRVPPTGECAWQGCGSSSGYGRFR